MVGRHQGLHHFTVGQGVDWVFLGERMYVKRLDKATNRVEIALVQAFYRTCVLFEDLHWINLKSMHPSLFSSS